MNTVPLTEPIDDPCKVQLSLMMKGMAGYRVKQYAKNHNIPLSLASKEIMLEGLKALGLVNRSYSLSDMRKGV